MIFGISLLFGLTFYIGIEASYEGSPEKLPGVRFDPTEGSGRTVGDCQRRLPSHDDDVRAAQMELPGGRTARFQESVCNYTEWKELREEFLKDAWNQNYDHFNYYLERQKNASLRRPINYLEDWCIGCIDEPMLECDEKTSRCTCYRNYVTYPKDEQYKFCRLKRGDFCTVKSQYTACIDGAFCEKDSNTCICEGTSRSCNEATSVMKLNLFYSWMCLAPVILNSVITQTRL